MNTNQANINNDNRTESELEAKAFGKIAKRPNGSGVKKPTKQRNSGRYERYSDAQIALAVEGVKIYGMGVVKAAARGGIRTTILCDALRCYKTHGKTSPSKRGRKAKSSFTEETVSFILNQVDQNPHVSIEDIYFAFVNDGMMAIPAVSSLQKWLRKNGQITFQRVQCYPPLPSEKEEEEYVHTLWQMLDAGEVDVCKNCISIGEGSYAYNLRRIYPETVPTTSSAEQDQGVVAEMNLLVAFGTTGIVEQSIRCLKGLTLNQVMVDFVKRVATKLNDQSMEKFFFGLDGGPAQETEQLKREIESWGHKVFFLPRHDGSSNPVEKRFREVQHMCSRSLLNQRKNETI
ncbi:hypothetical protein INT45_005901 [Circinella minor]|uniref:Uncharacterized protein n=1 Tax=Circinella minor TaxID=1195481 RepID=A0A8H7VAU9_9FUNG|nr:hypothetical protein INT45_005901 [Circinella minor]